MGLAKGTLPGPSPLLGLAPPLLLAVCLPGLPLVGWRLEDPGERVDSRPT